MNRLTIIAIIVCGAGCGDHGRTDALISAGGAASKQLQSYYDHLTATTLDWWEYQVAYNTLQDVTTSKEAEQLMADRLKALEARSTAAARLAGVYASMAQLRNPKAAQPVLMAANNLGKSLTSIPNLPGIDATEGLGKAAEFLTGMQRSRNFRDANNALTTTLKALLALMTREQEAYLAMVRDREQTRQALLASLARRQLINTTPLLDRLHLGVTWNASANPETARAIALNTARITSQRSITAWNCATNESIAMLTMLGQAHEQLPGTPDPAPLQRSIARAGTCLAEGGPR